MNSDADKPPQHVFDFVEKALSIVDQDIAEPYRKFTPGHFDVKIPLLAQIARDLGTICANIKNTNIQVGNPDGDKKGGANGYNKRQSIT